MDLCTKCKQRPRQSLTSTNPWCKVCNNAARKARYTPERGRKINLRDHYKGFSHEQYEEMFALQSELCAVCGRPETVVNPRTKKVQHLHVDHCHTTGRVRALLCHECNTAYGQLREDPERIRMLLFYAEKQRAESEV